jgi:hypothetical protein
VVVFSTEVVVAGIDLNGVVVSIAPGADVVVGIGVGATVSVTVT